MQQPPYQCKCDLFETVDELRLLYGADMDTLLGEDANRNGILDPNETDDNQNGMLDPGVLEYFTVYSREPNTNSDGSARINIASLSSRSTQLTSLLQTNFGTARANQILGNLGLVSGGPAGGRAAAGSGSSTTTVRFTSPLQFYVKSGMTATEFALIATNLTATSGAYVEGRVNVNTASAAVLACLLEGDTAVAEQLVNYRQSNPNSLTSIAWVIDALGQSYPDALQALQAGDYITTQSYQFTADIAALGPYGRGYRRVKFVFDTSSGTPEDSVSAGPDSSRVGPGQRGASELAPGEGDTMINLTTLDRLKRQRLSGVLGLALDGSRLDGIVLRRTNGALQTQQSFSVSLSLDPLTNDPELVGREIRNHLDAAGVRERQCIVGLPLKWALTDARRGARRCRRRTWPSFLQIEAERGFPCDVQTLHVVTSRSQSPSGKQHATLVGIPKNHLALLEQALRAAKLKPVSFSLGIAALQPAGAEASNGVMALAIGESHVGLQVTAGGGVAALRALEGALEAEGSQRVLHADLVAREARITLGQLPAELRETVRRIRVFGPRDLAQQLVDEMELRLDATGLKVEPVGRYAAGEFGIQLPPDASRVAGLQPGGQPVGRPPPAIRVPAAQGHALAADGGALLFRQASHGHLGGGGGGAGGGRPVLLPAMPALAARVAMDEDAANRPATGGPAGANPAIPPVVRRIGARLDHPPASHRGLSRRRQRDGQDRGDTGLEHGHLHRHRPQLPGAAQDGREAAQGPANPRREPRTDPGTIAGAAIHVQLPMERRRQECKLRIASNSSSSRRLPPSLCSRGTGWCCRPS